ncbi:energy transducer TonB [Flammeovirga sp. OC4]|uniref:energy transducer TonB n=1 Tax=Flammeovirga sp. OC4 TaxID=1382345 RepID=UPI0009E4DBF3|nr:energy transducer TonB [Flammeovirga sp. OC4]
MKQIVLTLFLMFNVFLSFGQSKIFLNQNLTPVKAEKRAHYFITTKQGKKIGGNFRHIIYFKNGQVYSIFNTKKPNFNQTKEGPFITYFQNGNKRLEGEYRQSVKVGIWKQYHENGLVNLEYEIEYEQIPNNPKMLLLNGWDTLGNQTLKDGQGYVKYIATKSSDLKISNKQNLVIVEGQVKKYKRDKVWKGKYLTGEKYFEETYSKGKLKKGISWDKNENQFSYTRVIVPPVFPGGMAEFYKQVRRKFEYPQEAKMNGEQGKVYIRFIVQPTGKLSNFKVMRGVSPSINEEALRVMNLVPDWEPRKVKGQPVTSTVVIPIIFNLGSQ